MGYNILISGGTGFIGKALSAHLKNKGHSVAILSRRSTVEEEKSFQWNLAKKTMDPAAIEFADIIINLVGESVSKRWTTARKERILKSRVDALALFKTAIDMAKSKPKQFISASATGIYGYETTDKIFKETDTYGDDYLAGIVKAWEQAADDLQIDDMSVIKVRIGVVLDKSGGALQKISAPLAFSPAVMLGNGQQYMPWISLNDLIMLFDFLINKDTLKYDVYNAVAPTHLTNREMMVTLGQKRRRPVLPFGVPAFVLKMALGKMASILLNGSRVSSQRIEAEGFVFTQPDFADVNI